MKKKEIINNSKSLPRSSFFSFFLCLCSLALTRPLMFFSSLSLFPLHCSFFFCFENDPEIGFNHPNNGNESPIFLLLIYYISIYTKGIIPTDNKRHSLPNSTCLEDFLSSLIPCELIHNIPKR